MSYHFIGIGGIGMSSLAKILLQKNVRVKGSDHSTSDLLLELQARGAVIYKGHKKENIFKGDTVVYSSAIKEDNPEIVEARAKKLKIIHRSELLKNLTAGHLPLLVTGTHGKTTTTSLLAQVLLDSSLDPTYSIGGILNSTKSNANLGSGKYFVAEADESDGSFLNYSGFGGIILNIEKEHFAYWKNIENVKQGYSKFISNMERKDLVIWCMEDKILKEINPPGVSYGFSKDADLVAENIRHEGFQMVFDLIYKRRRYSDVRLNLLGRHNVLNAMAVFLLSKKIGIEEEQIFQTFNSFSGVKRRMDKIGEVNKAVFFDDYGHHPSEIKATLAGLRKGVKEKRILCVFQPHRFSRVKEQFDEFGKSFADADELIITDIYSAGEDEKEKIDSSLFALKIKEDKKKSIYIEKDKLKSFLPSIILPHDVVIFFGAGDITKVSREVFYEYQNSPSKLKVAILFGGKSSFSDLSKMSALSISENLDPLIYDVSLFYVGQDGKWTEVDKKCCPALGKSENYGTVSPGILKKLSQSHICFPIFHGASGEDGMIQGFLDTLNLSYIGPSYYTCSCLMNKAWVKYIARENGIPVLDFIEIRRALWAESKDEFLKLISKKFKLPIFLKPCNKNLSLGIKKIESLDKLEELIEEGFSLDDSLILEQGTEGQEIEVAVLGNNFVEATIPGEVLTGGGFPSFEKKCGKKGLQSIIPANISSDISDRIKGFAIRLYKVFGCRGMAKVDFYVAGENIYLNEITPVPSFSKVSLYPKMWIKSGVEYKDLLDRLIIIGLNKKLVSYE